LELYLSRTEKEGELFNIRWLGAVHAAIFLAVIFGFLAILRRLTFWKAVLVASAAVWIFTDVLYVAYFNSFYTDTAALLGLLGSTVSPGPGFRWTVHWEHFVWKMF